MTDQNDTRATEAPPAGLEAASKGHSFTILELIVVGFGLLVVAGIFGPGLLRAKAQDKFTECKKNLVTIGEALEAYQNDRGGYPANLDGLLPNYLSALPECPAAGEVSYRASYGKRAPQNPESLERFAYLYCEGLHHEDFGADSFHPAYSSTEGLQDR